ncbi:MAG: amidohydrolase family protein [Bryobacteraceae bacterium]
MRLDAHQRFTPEHTPEHFAPILKRNRFDGSLAVAASAWNTARLLEIADRFDFVRGVVAWGELEDIRTWRAHPKLRGVVGLPSWPVTVFEQIAAWGLPVELEDLPLAIELGRRAPSLRVAIVHLGLPEECADWERVMEEAARNPLFASKASGLITHGPKPWNAARFRPWVRHALAVFGPERVMFGSDWPRTLPDNIWKEALAAFTQAIGAQSMETREWLLGGAAARFYGI